MKVAATMAILMLAGCTTVSELRTHSPRAAYVSNSSPAALEQCLAGNLSWISLPATIRGPETTELIFGSGQSAVVGVTLTPLQQGTRVEVRQLATYGARVRQNIEACVAGRPR